MLHFKIQDGRLDTIEVQGLAEAEAAINLLTAYAPFMQIPAPPAKAPSTKRKPSRAINPDHVAEALRAIGHPAHTPEIRAELHARGIFTTASRMDGDIREVMRRDPQQRFMKEGPSRNARWMLREWAEPSGMDDAAPSTESPEDCAAGSLRPS